MTPRLAWLADDFTGGAAVAEVLAFGGVPAALFLEPPTPALLARLPGLEAWGLATTARAETPAWMDAHLPPLMAALLATGAPLLHYKACSTLDSAPDVGSLGRALEIGLRATGEDCAPLLFASPPMGRWQAFGTLFAAGPGGTHRLDRHPVMSRHPVTPMDEADVARHLARQTDLPLAALHRPDLSPESFGALERTGARGVALDCAGVDDLAACGRIVAGRRFALGSQGVEEALLSHWREAGVLPDAAPPPRPAPVDRIVAVSGSASAVTAAQIARAEARGWAVVPLDAPALFGPLASAAIAAAIEEAARAARAGLSVVVAALRGTDDPALRASRRAMAAADVAAAAGEARIGEALGSILAALLAEGEARALVAGGDTSGRVARALGLVALEPLAFVAHGASLMRGHRARGAPFEIILKGGQMGREDLFDRALGARHEGRAPGARDDHREDEPARDNQGGRLDHSHHAA